MAIMDEDATETRGTIMAIINAGNHCSIFLVTAYMLYLAGLAPTVTSIHAGLCTVGFVLLMSESLLIFTKENVWSRHIPKRRTRSHLHWILQVFGAACNISGMLVMSKSKIDDNNSRSLHSIIGLTAIIIMDFLCLSGVTLFYTVKLKKLFRPAIFKFVHDFLGIMCFLLGITAQCLGYNKKWMKKAAGKNITILAMILTIMSTTLCILQPVKSVSRHFRAALKSKRM